MKKGARQSRNVLDLRGPHKSAYDEVQSQRVRMDKTHMFNKTPIAQQKPDVLEDILNSMDFAGNNNPRGRISDLGVKPTKFKKPSKGK